MDEPSDATGWTKTMSLPINLGDEPFLQPVMDRQVSLTLIGRSVNDIKQHIKNETGKDPNTQDISDFEYTLKFKASRFFFLYHADTSPKRWIE